jgi:hypothetical protein
VDGLFVSLENSIVKVISTLISANVSINWHAPRENRIRKSSRSLFESQAY